MKHFEKAICIKEGIYNDVEFKIGDIYALVGDNNATQLVYKDKIGDTKVMMLTNYTDNAMCEWSVDSDASNYPEFTRLED